MTDRHSVTPPPPHLLKKFSAQAQDEAKKRNGAGYLKTFATLCIEWALTCQSTPNDRQIRSSEIKPSPELVQQWLNQLRGCPGPEPTTDDLFLAAQAAEWAADQELEACIKLLSDLGGDGEMIRRHRRPKPQSLAEEALEEVGAFEGMGTCNIDIIRRALERLQELEGQE